MFLMYMGMLSQKYAVRSTKNDLWWLWLEDWPQWWLVILCAVIMIGIVVCVQGLWLVFWLTLDDCDWSVLFDYRDSDWFTLDDSDWWSVCLQGFWFCLHEVITMSGVVCLRGFWFDCWICNHQRIMGWTRRGSRRRLSLTSATRPSASCASPSMTRTCSVTPTSWLRPPTPSALSALVCVGSLSTLRHVLILFVSL